MGIIFPIKTDNQKFPSKTKIMIKILEIVVYTTVSPYPTVVKETPKFQKIFSQLFKFPLIWT